MTVTTLSNGREESVLHPGTEKYEQSRNLYFNKEETGRYPVEIHIAQSVQDVSNALQRARTLGVPVGVRSGGHLPSKPSLIDKGLLIDLSHVNRHVSYDSESGEVSFGPAVRVYEAWKATDAVGRFFPFGHAPDVALGGFCLAGGQGFFMRGWGATITNWIVKLEIVVPDGRVLIASKTENPDLFWAARGAGQAFFGVVTRIWSRTIPKKTHFGRSYTFAGEDKLEAFLSSCFDRNDQMPKSFTETAACTLHSELFESNSSDETVPSSSPLLLLVNISAYADTLAEAERMLSVWDEVPDSLKSCLIETKPVAEVDWEEFFKLQHLLNPQTPNQKWNINSILSDPSIPRDKLIEAIRPAMCNLPTRSSYGCIYMADTLNPDERDALFSIPQQYYISTFSG
ncbi:FAD binding domain-containing [Fusarium albosuccineum]|uniref:FAD binding domain-containing n=1 Tax=Fusarium albosuccineum TaxID=1237068 RepID=A0A8H4KWE7_9HYPO|nr:FAD binding domain-containing [Fusarium albosuccineum]